MGASGDRPSFDASERCARELDRGDPLAAFRARFCVPTGAIYLDGNSLGLLGRDAERAMHEAIEQWKNLAVRGWLEADPPWFHLGETLGALAAPLVGAEPEAVVHTGTTTVNIHALVSTLFRPTGGRRKILADALDFPTDIYALRGQLALRGCDPDRDLVLVPSDDGRTIDEGRAIEMMTDEVALALLPAVLYRSGQLLDLPRLARAARQRGIIFGVDAAHSVGAVPHHFDAWEIDFAVWCAYKHLNGGPGSSAFLYLNRRHFGCVPALPGWFGSDKQRQFDMALDFVHQRGAGGWQLSAPGIIAAAAVRAALAVHLEAGIEAIRAKSILLTSYLINLVDRLLADARCEVTVGTPRDPARRGGHVSLELADGEVAHRISVALRRRGVIPDFRPPNVIRLAPVALYNTFHEVWRVVHQLREIIDSGEHLEGDVGRAMIT